MIIKFKRFLTYFLLLCAMNFRNEGDHTSPQLPIFCSINQLYPLTISLSIYMCPSLLSCAPFSSVYAASFKFLVMCPKRSCTLRSFVVEIHSLIIQHSQKKKRFGRPGEGIVYISDLFISFSFDLPRSVMTDIL